MKIVIEVKGGVVQDVYSDSLEVQIVVVDWDADGNPQVGNYATSPLGKMSKETKKAVDQ